MEVGSGGHEIEYVGLITVMLHTRVEAAYIIFSHVSTNNKPPTAGLLK